MLKTCPSLQLSDVAGTTNTADVRGVNAAHIGPVDIVKVVARRSTVHEVV